jgi:2-C-methyl-D-erythritol 2,4-cyclodiphosphate synthase
MYRIGIGSDIHRLVRGRKLVIGGVEIESELGADGHSDADVLLHAITDAVLGSLALGDIGSHFPDSDARWKDAASSVFLHHAVGSIRDRGFEVVNIDSIIELERPKLRPEIDNIRARIAEIVGVDADQISVKAKTSEGVDAVGEGRALRAQAIVLIQRV